MVDILPRRNRKQRAAIREEYQDLYDQVRADSNPDITLHTNN